ncbi:MAG TPA: sigma-70 family RNA polymerase sigma factor [Gemmatales bacterium]|nr:sigma-70 family RNA polymerase sigma factor [Gemmatales bacterium]HMP60241.1 sigma-70 family RNA polymerase sigma factor [Gemmatales bacterium]
MQPTSVSLLERLRDKPSDADWHYLVGAYTPLIHGWLRRHAALSAADADDLTQEVLSVVVRELPSFRHSQQAGAFRHWLRNVTVNRVRNFLRSSHGRAAGSGDSAILACLSQLEDSQSHLSQVWDREHDLHVAGQLLKQMEREFQPKTWLAFKRTALDGLRAPEVAAELGMTVKAVVVAKSRILKRLREEAQGLIDAVPPTS